MADKNLTVRIPVKAEILVRFQGSEELHLLGVVEQDFPVEFVPPADGAVTRFQFAPGVM